MGRMNRTNLDFRVMRDSRLSVYSRDDGLPNTEIILYHSVGISIPVVYQTR